MGYPATPREAWLELPQEGVGDGHAVGVLALHVVLARACFAALDENARVQWGGATVIGGHDRAQWESLLRIGAKG